MEKPLAIANELILLANSCGSPLTQMKLQKLIFFAHGWYLAICDEPLIDESFQAWRYGPVLPSVYDKFKIYGMLGIDKPGAELVYTANGFEWNTPRVTDNTGNVKDLLDKIWDVFGKYSGTQLSEMTHAPNTPWKKMREEYGDARSISIPNKLIKDYFKGLMNNAE